MISCESKSTFCKIYLFYNLTHVKTKKVIRRTHSRFTVDKPTPSKIHQGGPNSKKNRRWKENREKGNKKNGIKINIILPQKNKQKTKRKQTKRGWSDRHLWLTNVKILVSKGFLPRDPLGTSSRSTAVGKSLPPSRTTTGGGEVVQPRPP